MCFTQQQSKVKGRAICNLVIVQLNEAVESGTGATSAAASAKSVKSHVERSNESQQTGCSINYQL